MTNVAHIAASWALLPPEIVSLIVYFLPYYPSLHLGEANDPTPRQILSSASLVCRHWCEQLRPSLWEELTLKSRAELRELVGLGRRVSAWVRAVRLLRSSEEDWIPAATALFPALAAALPRLTRICWDISSWIASRGVQKHWSTEPVPSRACAHMSSFRAVTLLTLDTCAFRSLELFMRFVSSLPLLETLHCYDVDWTVPSAGWSPPRRAKVSGRLAHMKVRGCLAPWLLLWLFSPSSRAVRTDVRHPGLPDEDIAVLVSLIRHAKYERPDTQTWDLWRTYEGLCIQCDTFEVSCERTSAGNARKDSSNPVMLLGIVMKVAHRWLSILDTFGDFDWQAIDGVLSQLAHLRQFHVVPPFGLNLNH